MPEEEDKLGSDHGARVFCSCSYFLHGGFARTVALVTRQSQFLSLHGQRSQGNELIRDIVATSLSQLGW